MSEMCCESSGFRHKAWRFGIGLHVAALSNSNSKTLLLKREVNPHNSLPPPPPPTHPHTLLKLKYHGEKKRKNDEFS